MTAPSIISAKLRSQTVTVVNGGPGFRLALRLAGMTKND